MTSLNLFLSNIITSTLSLWITLPLIAIPKYNSYKTMNSSRIHNNHVSNQWTTKIQFIRSPHLKNKRRSSKICDTSKSKSFAASSSFYRPLIGLCPIGPPIRG
mmetsp:Transcript_16344/g.33138  ORF Transcript_16344/g.33138 Transcript_16344/m.33138 type:complete len:103 (+) Transcript_16344:80-388(+)